MSLDKFNGAEKREFVRFDCVSPLAFKVCKETTISKLLEGYTANISPAGALCRITEKVNIGDILWLALERSALIMCTEIEKRSLIYQNGVIGKVVRIESRNGNEFHIGIQFLTREEKNLTNIYSTFHFIEQGLKDE
ncbi:MAG: PilZ domain-containing protein [Candidatus Omnitrophota bacterium]